MRDHTLLGSATVPAGIAVPHQANPATDQKLPFLQSYTICSFGKLFAVQQGGLDEPWQQRHKQDKGPGL